MSGSWPVCCPEEHHWDEWATDEEEEPYCDAGFPASSSTGEGVAAAGSAGDAGGRGDGRAHKYRHGSTRTRKRGGKKARWSEWV